MPRRRAECGIERHRSRLRRLVRRLGYRWKRCRRRLRGPRDPQALAACQAHSQTWPQAEARGEIAGVYVDECRFSRQAPVPYAWQVRGQPPVERPAVRAAGGYSGLGFWQANGAGQRLDADVKAGSLTAEIFVLIVNEFVSHITQPTVLVLDNASLHKAHLGRACQAGWAARGLTPLFLPPYSPELNNIELLWHRGKHYWIRPEDYASDLTLLERGE